MGEIDTKPIRSVQTAISFFGQISTTADHRKTSPIRDDDSQQEAEKDGEIESLMKDLANMKLQLEAKESAHKQVLLMLDHHQKTADDLSTLLQKSDHQKMFYINEQREAKLRVDELESAMKLMTDQLSESEKIKGQLSQVTSDLESAKRQLLEMQTEILNLREAKAESISKAEAMESAFEEEQQKMEELMIRLSEMNKSKSELETRVLEMEKDKIEAVSEKEAELELARKSIFEVQEQLECTKKELETLQDLEHKLLEKSITVDYFQLELKQANGLIASSEKATSDAISELNKLKEEMGVLEEMNLYQLTHISLLESGLEISRTELRNAKEEVNRINEHSENLKSDLEKSKEKENDSQVEIALLKFELHKGRSKLAAAEAEESKVQGEKSALYNALQQMGLEAEEAKRENRMLKEAIKTADESNASSVVETSDEIHSESGHEVNKENKDENSNQVSENGEEVENVKRELELAMAKMGELRTRAEQAISRAEAAEKAKAVLEDKMKKQREHKEKRKAALAALREESVSRDYSPSGSIAYEAEKRYQPLGKVLNMKF